MGATVKQFESFWKFITIILLTVTDHASASTQSHQGSAATNEFNLSKAHPDVRLRIASSNTIYIVNVDLPSEPQFPAYKVKLELLAMQLCDDDSGNDRLKIVHSDPTSIKTDTWKVNATASVRAKHELTNIQANQIVLIPEGRWVRSQADIVATLYQDALTDGDDKRCPPDTFSCDCSPNDEKGDSNDVQNSAKYCVPNTLICNGVPNCECRDDEMQPSCVELYSTILKPTVHIPLCSEPMTEPPQMSSPNHQENVGGGVSRAEINGGVHFMVMVLFSWLIR